MLHISSPKRAKPKNPPQPINTYRHGIRQVSLQTKHDRAPQDPRSPLHLWKARCKLKHLTRLNQHGTKSAPSNSPRYRKPVQTPANSDRLKQKHSSGYGHPDTLNRIRSTGYTQPDTLNRIHSTGYAQYTHPPRKVKF